MAIHSWRWRFRQFQHYRNRLRACTSQCASIELERQFWSAHRWQQDFFTTMQWTVFGSTSGSVWTRTRFRLSCSEEYAQMINICSPVQEEMKEREDPSRASQQCAVISPSTIRRRIAVWVKLDSSKSDGQSRVYEISGDTRESVNRANRLDQKFVDTCNDEYAEWLRTNRFSFQFRSKQGSWADCRDGTLE